MGKHIRFIAIDGELWKPIKGYEQYYLISSFGRVRSVSNRITNPAIRTEDRILKQYLKSTGYLSVRLVVKNVVKKFLVHRLVANAFIPNPYDKSEVNHKDFNKMNNRIDNLEWCTGKENYIHAVKGGKCFPPSRKQYKMPLFMKPPSGADNPYAKTFYQYDNYGNFIQELKGIGSFSRKICGQSRTLQKYIKTHKLFYGFRYSYIKADKLL